MSRRPYEVDCDVMSHMIIWSVAGVMLGPIALLIIFGLPIPLNYLVIPVVLAGIFSLLAILISMVRALRS